MAGGLVGELTSLCILGRVVLKEATFQVTIWIWWSIIGWCLGVVEKEIVMGMGGNIQGVAHGIGEIQ